EKYIGLAALQDRNEHLFYRLLCDHLEEFMPIVYTPTVGEATREFSNVFRRGRGIWITPDFKGRIAEVLRKSVDYDDIRLIVVTDNEAILGIGDQGAGGMAISIGKLALYVAGAGIHPAHTLPVSLDVGTNNEELLKDELYLGWRHPRLTGDDYFELVDEFIAAVREVMPRALIQFEDFRNLNAFALLRKYRDKVLCFNDDIQGTGAVALAGILTALRVTGKPLAEQRIVIMGAGAAGYGIAKQLLAALSEAGLKGDDLTAALAAIDRKGLVIEGGVAEGDYKAELAWPRKLLKRFSLDAVDKPDLAAVVAAYKPTVLIGSSGQAGAFSEAIVRSMAEHAERPIILPFSNPTDHAEATPADLYAWTDGKALVATGSPFDPVTHKGRTYQVGQGNNVFIFPGLGLGALIAGAGKVTDGMISAASAALAAAVSQEELESGLLFPAVTRLRPVSRAVTKAVVLKAIEDGVAKPLTDEEIEWKLDDVIWEPSYPDYVAV
ncbi:MAG: NAD-dependent malic enzyme, partial [Gammaproteobacteria bacterium]|nr:NAD-dependent malic enzyme [Gammaproteobacteria bacterium]